MRRGNEETVRQARPPGAGGIHHRVLQYLRDIQEATELNGFFMTGEIGLLFGVLLLLSGVISLCTASNADTFQVVGGAVLASLGTIVCCLVVKSKLEWRRNYKANREH
jgi:hypothetical protein